MLLQTEKLKYTDSGLFFLLAGPCVIEGENMDLLIGNMPLRDRNNRKDHRPLAYAVCF